MADNRRTALEYLLGKGLTRAQAAGVVGSLMQESGLRTDAVNPSSGATGIGQWLGGRKTNLQKAGKAGSLRGQLDFLWGELQGPENAALKRLQGAHTVADAAAAFTWGFERPGQAEANMANRINQGRAALGLTGGLTPARHAQATGEEPAQTLAPAQPLALTTPQRPQIQITAPTAPTFAAKPVVAQPAGVVAPAQLPATPKPQPERLDVGKALEAIMALQPQQQEASGAGGATSPSRDSGSPASGGTGAFKIEGPDPGRLRKPLTSFATRVADVFGGTLEGKDGSSHSKYTVNGNVSDHYAGNATDIFKINGKPATGKRLIQAGRAALVAAGMDPRKARKAPGGLYNVNGHQIIFGVSGQQYGGNHLDHLHISAK